MVSPRTGGHFQHVLGPITAEDGDGIMVGFVEIVGGAPVHAGGEIVLIMFTPAPDGGWVGRHGLAVVGGLRYRDCPGYWSRWDVIPRTPGTVRSDRPSHRSSG